MLPEELEHTQNAKCDVARVQRGGVVADFAFVHPLQVEAGPEDGEWKVPTGKSAGVQAEAWLYIGHCVIERGDARAVTYPADLDEGLQYLAPRLRGRERHVTGEACICIRAGLYFTWRHCKQRK